MLRRKFIRGTIQGSALGSLLSVTGLSSCASEQKENTSKEAANAIPPFELEEITVKELRVGMESGKYTARSIAELYLKRIEEIDKNGPKLNAVIEVNPDALTIADQMDKERSEGKIRGPLHGIPIMIKDNIDTGDKMQTTAGALALAGSKAKEELKYFNSACSLILL